MSMITSSTLVIYLSSWLGVPSKVGSSLTKAKISVALKAVAILLKPLTVGVKGRITSGGVDRIHIYCLEGVRGYFL